MAPSFVGSPILAIERELILQTLEYCGGNHTHAAKLLKISLRALRYKLRHYQAQGFSEGHGLPRRRKPGGG
jgi:DNA-binding NtrC family response regulator